MDNNNGYPVHTFKEDIQFPVTIVQKTIVGEFTLANGDRINNPIIDEECVPFNKDQDVVFISGNTPSSKNSKVATSKGVFHSKTVMKWLRSLNIQHYSVTKKTVKGYKNPTRPNLFLEAFNSTFLNTIKDLQEQGKVIKLGFYFHRGTRHKADFHNLVQILLDLLVAHNILEDDNMNCVLPIPLGDGYELNKDNPGCLIQILN